jgi:ATP-binding cassette subfamily F protein 3
LLSLQNISIQFGGEYLFEDVSLYINANDRIGLVGSNGAGKTTLFKILIGKQEPSSGVVQKAKYVSIGYLQQETEHLEGRSLIDEAESAFDDVKKIENDLEEIHLQLQNTSHESAEFNDLIELQGEFQHKLESLDAFRIRSKTEKVLMGLGFSVDDFQRDCNEFSGGWQMRISLAKLLLKNPSLLLLDEPTNHLDIESLEWLENYLRSYEGAIMLISHDRTFLDNMTKRTFAIVNGNVEEYVGNYSFYETESVARKELVLAAFKNQQQQIKQTEQFIERFRYKATKARQVQSRIKQLDKVERIEIEDEESAIHFHFPSPPPSGKVVMELKNISKQYDDNLVLSNLNFTVERGDRIAFVGVNGAGKSTLSKIIAGVEKLSSGERNVGYNVSIAYFAQHQADELDGNKSVYESAAELSVGESRTRLQTLLGSFLFRGDDVEKKVRVLSGGEKSRLALARMLLSPANVLVLDEPTNHLDMRSKKILQEALEKFDGTYIIVSHDRYFLDSIVNKVIEVKNHSIKTYIGNVSEYLLNKKEEVEMMREGEKVEKTVVSSQNRKRLEAEERQRLHKLTKPLKEKLQKVEKEIAEKEKRKDECEKLMSDTNFYTNAEQVKIISKEYKPLINALESLYFEWGKITDEMERVVKNA